MYIISAVRGTVNGAREGGLRYNKRLLRFIAMLHFAAINYI